MSVARALESCPGVATVFVQRRTGGAANMVAGRDHWLDEAVAAADTVCRPEVMEAEDPLFLLYTSGSTGKPKVSLSIIFVCSSFCDKHCYCNSVESLPPHFDGKAISVA